MHIFLIFRGKIEVQNCNLLELNISPKFALLKQYGNTGYKRFNK